jgi:hypothetical protein
MAAALIGVADLQPGRESGQGNPSEKQGNTSKKAWISLFFLGRIQPSQRVTANPNKKAFIQLNSHPRL